MKPEIKERIEKIKRGEVPEGYKRTRFGFTPIEWEEKKLGSYVKVYSGGTPSTNNQKYYNGDIPWITSSDLNRKTIYSVEHFISESGFNNSSAKMVEKNTLLLALYGATAGVVAITRIKAAINQAILAIISDTLDTDYLFFWLDFNKESIISTFTQGGQPNLSGGIIKTLDICVPLEFTQQHQIADILATWDRAIELKEQLIEEKQKLKKWLMQNLLTGKKRLPGFEGSLKKEQLKGYIKELSKRNQDNNVKRVLTVTNTDGFVSQDEHFGRIIASKDTSNYKLVLKRQFAFNPSRINVGSIGLLKNYDVGALSPMYVVFETNHDLLLPEYLEQFTKTDNFNEQVKNLLQGSVRQGLNYKSLELIVLYVPKIKEQEAIVKVLAMADKEISFLQQELTLLKEQKKSLMQLLLSGIVRVPEAYEEELKKVGESSV